MATRVRSSKAAPAIVRRVVTARECRWRIGLAAFIGIVETAAAVVCEPVGLKLAFGVVALSQLSQVWVWYGMLERIKRGESVEVAAGTAAAVNVPTAVGYIAATLLSALTVLWNLMSLFLLVFILAHPTPGKLALLGFLFTIGIGISFLSVYVWKRVLADAKTAQTLQTAAAATATSDGIHSSTATVVTGINASPSSRPKHWWTDTAIREETQINRNRRGNGDSA